MIESGPDVPVGIACWRVLSGIRREEVLGSRVLRIMAEPFLHHRHGLIEVSLVL